jgi:hypothetical protein
MKKSGFVILIVLILAIAVVSVLTTGFGLPDNVVRRSMLPEFEERRAQWESANITHYQIKAYARNPYSACSGAVLEIRNGKVINLDSVTDEPDFTGLSTDCADSPEFRQQYAQFTVESAFDTAEHYLNEVTEIGTIITVDIEYDEQYGFPTVVNVYSSTISHMPYILIKEFKIITD